MLDWNARDKAAAILELTRDAERCPGCRLHPDDARHVEAVSSRCPTCEHADVIRDNLEKLKPEAVRGMRVGFDVLTDPDEAAEFSSWALYTKDGREARYRREQGE